MVTKETLAALPEETQRILTQKCPDVFEDLYGDTVLGSLFPTKSDIIDSAKAMYFFFNRLLSSDFLGLALFV